MASTRRQGGDSEDREVSLAPDTKAMQAGKLKEGKASWLSEGGQEHEKRELYRSSLYKRISMTAGARD